jgi:hypothetical protein
MAEVGNDIPIEEGSHNHISEEGSHNHISIENIYHFKLKNNFI